MRAQALEGLERKLKAAMRSTTLNRMAPDLEALVRAETIAVQAGPRPSADEAMLTAIRGAVLAQQPLGFTYARPGAEPRRRSVTPCGVMFGRANYLVAADRETGRIQTFRLDRMSHVAPQDGVATPPADFDLGAFASQSFGIYQDEIEDVVLRISPEGAAEARGWTIGAIWNTHWHPDHTGGNAAIKAATGAAPSGSMLTGEATPSPTIRKSSRCSACWTRKPGSASG